MTTPRLLRLAAPVLLLVLSAYLYGTHLGGDPLQPDEEQLAAAARTVAATGGHDASGRFLPVLIQVGEHKWLPGVPVYAGAVLIKLFPDKGSLRWAAAMTGILDVLLVYLIAIKLFRSASLAFVAGLMTLLSPAHMTYSRLALTDGVWQVPFVAVWLIGLIGFVNGWFLPARWMLALGVASLAAGVYSQPAAGVTLPWFGLITIIAVSCAARWRSREIVPAVAALALSLAPLAVWFAAHPSTYIDTIGAWALHPAYIRNPLEWARAWSNGQTLAASGGIFWDFLRPSHLFLNAGLDTPVFSTLTGIFLVYGIFEIIRTRSETNDPAIVIIRRVVLPAFFVGPLAASTFKQSWPIQRALVVVPFGVLLASAGLWALWTRYVRRARSV